ncbi:MAG: hypothetical protein APG08_01314 [Candidatus Methanofastidiosum methylothiophilum]|jgi:flagellin-like protein|nr:MAG: hypothetical protein APG08_01314 [Candidatus Methanofastidiosum methylthiophilus]HNZ59837.1 hypothetical protein [Methanofastidiosum sp.]HPX23829.1 hypothetical protein [Methanofastidiosum sp.]HQC24606.1 hypothetical protein [Methanofastidiosum sp.]
MMKFFRKHKKAVSPVIAVMLLVAVAVAAVGAYFIWFRSFQTQTQKGVQEASSGALGTGLQVVSFTDDGKVYYVVLKNTLSSGVLKFTGAKVNPPGTGNNLNTTFTDVSLNTGIVPGESKTYRLNPNGFSLATGKTRTFLLEANNSTVVTSVTYADS